MYSKKTPFLYLGSISAFPLLVFDLYQPAMPAITAYFNTTHALSQLTLSLFFFILGLSQLIWGPLIDHYGRRKNLYFSFTLFIIATLFCLLATHIYLLIIGRALQGFAVCCLSVIAFVSSRDEEDSTNRARLFSHIAMIVSVSPIFAPLLGSFIFIHFGWRSTFILMGIMAIILLFLGHFKLRESPFWKESKPEFSIKSTLSTYMELLSHKRMQKAMAIISSSYSCVMIVVVNASYLVIDDLGISPSLFSSFFACNGMVIILGNYLGIKLRKHYSLNWNIRLGSFLMFSGALLTLFLFFKLKLSLISLAPTLIINLGMILLNPPTVSLAMADYKEQAGAATALLNTARVTSSAVTGGIVGALLFYSNFILPLSLLFFSILSLISCYFWKMKTTPNIAKPITCTKMIAALDD